MAVVGVDFGNNSCYISVARAGGIETIANDYSMRDTPTVVGFSEKQRIMGVGGKNQMLTNLKKTVFNFKHMLGRKFRDPKVQAAISGLPYDVSEGKQGEVRINVNYLGENKSFTPEEVTAMLFTKLKETAEAALDTKVKDMVISCPAYFVDSERRAILDAAAIAGLNVLKLMNDTTATALAYGIYKQDLPAPEEKARNVVFVDVGHIGIQVAAASFNKAKLAMKAVAFDSNCAGKEFDSKIVKFIAEDFKGKTKLDPFTNKRALLKLTAESEKVKKQMSANTNMLPVNIECFMEERDLSCRIDRATFEELIAVELQRIEKVLEDALKATEWKLDDIHSVEVIGGSSRMPAVKAAIERVFGKQPQTTLNADEAVSRGCALQCAILSPTFRVREFSVTDIQPYPIKLLWKAEQDTGDMVVFPKFHQVPFSKVLTFYRRDNFAVEAEYEGNDVPVIEPHIGHFEIGDVKPLEDGGNQKVKVKVRVNLHGVFVVSSANFVEKHEIEEEVQMEVDPPKPEEEKKADTSGGEDNNKTGEQQAEDSKPEDVEMKSESKEDEVKSPPKKEMRTEKRKKIVSKTIDLPVTSRVVGALSRDKMETAVEQEKKFTNADRGEADRLTAKNSVEEYIYSIREKISEELEDYLTEQDRMDFSRKLEDTENWLYEEGEDCDKKTYEEKLKELKMVGEAAKKRKSEFDGRKAAAEALGHTIQMAQKAVDQFKSGDELYNHLAATDIERVEKLVKEKMDWLNNSIGIFPLP